MDEKDRWLGRYFNVCWWHPDGWILYSNGDTGPRPAEAVYDPRDDSWSWTPGTTPFPTDHVRAYPFDQMKTGKGLLVVVRDLSLVRAAGGFDEGAAYFLAGNLGFNFSASTTLSQAQVNGETAVEVWWERSATTNADGKPDGRLRPKWTPRYQIRRNSPNLRIPYWFGRSYPQWPKRAYRRS